MLKRGTASNLAVLSCVSRLHNTTESITIIDLALKQSSNQMIVPSVIPLLS